nr:hypothetical protein [Tanacetum cinerariifolium]
MIDTSPTLSISLQRDCVNHRKSIEEAMVGVMTELILRKCMEISQAESSLAKPKIDNNDTWAWVAPGPERQPNAAARDPMDVEDAQAERMARLDEEVLGICEVLGEHREVLDNMSHDFSRFTTWTVTSLSLMVDHSGVRCTSYADFSIPYRRCRVRQRTVDASTSAAPLDEDQPNP